MTEVDYAAAWSGATDGFDLDVVVQTQTCPGGAAEDYLDVPVAVAHRQLLGSWKPSGAYAPPRQGFAGVFTHGRR